MGQLYIQPLIHQFIDGQGQGVCLRLLITIKVGTYWIYLPVLPLLVLLTSYLMAFSGLCKFFLFKMSFIVCRHCVYGEKLKRLRQSARRYFCSRYDCSIFFWVRPGLIFPFIPDFVFTNQPCHILFIRSWPSIYSASPFLLLHSLHFRLILNHSGRSRPDRKSFPPRKSELPIVMALLLSFCHL